MKETRIACCRERFKRSQFAKSKHKTSRGRCPFPDSFRIAIPGAGPEDRGGFITPTLPQTIRRPFQEPVLHGEAKCRRDFVLRGCLLAFSCGCCGTRADYGSFDFGGGGSSKISEKGFL